MKREEWVLFIVLCLMLYAYIINFYKNSKILLVSTYIYIYIYIYILQVLFRLEIDYTEIKK